MPPFTLTPTRDAAPCPTFLGWTAEAVVGAADGISTAKTAADTKDAECYDLSGRRVAQPAKGIYVKNGKKVIVK